MGFVLLVDNNVFKNDFKDYIYNNLFMFILCKNKVHLLLNYVIYVTWLWYPALKHSDSLTENSSNLLIDHYCFLYFIVEYLLYLSFCQVIIC